MKLREGRVIMDILFEIDKLRNRRYEMDKVADALCKMGIDFKVNYGRGFIEIFPCWQIWFIRYEDCYKWGKGKTYYCMSDNKFYHSGIPMSDDEIKLNLAKPLNSKRDCFYPRAIAKFLQMEKNYEESKESEKHS